MIELRKALPDEAEQLSEIAHRSKRYWGYPEHWIEHWRLDLTISADFIRQHQVFVAEAQGKIVGFYALVAADDKLELDHLWVLPDQIGKGLGKMLFLHAMEMAHQQKCSEVGISSDPHAEGFYLKMGAVRVGEEHSEIDGKRRSLPRLKTDLKTD